MRRLVIGVGNPDRGDDAAGREVARRLAARGSASLEARECGGDATALLTAWAGARDVVVVDACRGAGPVGSVHSFGPDDALRLATLRHASTHSLGVAAAVGLARALGALPERLVIHAIEAGSCGHGEGLSPEVERAVERVVAEIDCPDAVLVIAWGNPLREDDGVAWHVAEALQALRPRPGLPALRISRAHSLAPELSECLGQAHGVVFVDARRDGSPGEVRCEATLPSAGSNPLAHSLSPQALLLMAERLYGRAPRAVLLGVTGARFGMGETLSPPVRRALPRAVRAVIRQARLWAQETEPTGPLPAPSQR
jgi:hydrogenase maturation protease